jgi:hypothetical protein
MEDTKTCYLTTYRKPITMGLGIFILGLLIGAFSMGHRGDRFEEGRLGGERFGGERGGCPMQADQNFRGQMMGGQKNCLQQAASGQALPAQPAK